MSISVRPRTFAELPISSGLKKALAASNFTNLKPIQSQAIPHLLSGRNVLGASPTGTGKTLAFLVPTIELLTYTRARPSHGTMAIVLSPARELALQTYAVAKSLMSLLSPTVLAVVGGQKGFKDEQYFLRSKGANLVIATPGRLRKHLEDGSVKHDHFQLLVIDEADRLLEEGFAPDLYAIFDILKPPRQLALFSATLTPDVEGLMNLNMSSVPIFCCPSDSVAVETLEHMFAVVTFSERIGVVAALLNRLRRKRVIVFVGGRREADFLARLFNAIDIPCGCLHGDMSQADRTLSFVQFNRNEIRALVATNVGSRGLDFPEVDWSVSLGPPSRVEDYIHRAGRSARNERFGQSLLLLAPNEEVFAARVRDAKIDVKKIALRIDGVDDVRERLESAVREGHGFVRLAKDAVVGFESGYRARPAAEGISIDDVNMDEVCASFGLRPGDYEE